MTQQPFADPYQGPVITDDEEALRGYPLTDDPIDPIEPIGTEPSDDSTKDVAKDQAAQVGQGAADAGKHVAGVAKDQAANVAGEAKAQARNLAEQARSEAQVQAHTQKQRVSDGLRSLGQELGSMAEKSEQPGTATDLARQASQLAHDAASWLEDRDPGALVGEVRSFARRRPGAFLGIALGAGVLAGRLTRGIAASGDDDTTGHSDSSTTGSSWTGEPDSGGVGYSAPAYETTVSGATYSTGTEPFIEYPVDDDAVSRETR